jgi:hypothetical protein
MLVERLPAAALEADDVRSFLLFDELAQTLDAGDVLEYWKSTPYLVNFMEDYKLGQAVLDAAYHGRHVELAPATNPLATIDWQRPESYGEIKPTTPRLRALFDDVIATDAWKLLWVTPSLPYYRLGGPYSNPGASAFTKRLIFSAWAAVPRSIAALTSYEAERRIMRPTRGRGPLNTAAARERERPLLRFARSGGRLVGMPVLVLIHPSPALARLADPLALAASADGGILEQRSVLRIAKANAREAIRPLISGRSGPPDPRWYWAAPFLLDDRADTANTDWLERWNTVKAWTGESDPSEHSALAAHIQTALDLIADERGGRSDLGSAPNDLADVIALLALAGPSVCALRSLVRGADAHERLIQDAYRDAAARAAWGLRSLFNLRETTHLIRSKDVPYWQRVLQYCFDGCLQATLDEYAHVLGEWLGVADRDPAEIAKSIGNAMNEVLTLRRVNYQVRELDLDGDDPVARRSIGGRFALRFGDERSDDGGETRRSHVRIAFNSPFWPFVLATTSIGQEGLDFHLYCHSVMHWNLPANPVDLEQREGRVHRYKGHAVRKNLGATLGTEAILRHDGDPWEWMFRHGAESRASNETDIVPLWVYTVGGARIERVVPALPLSRDRARLEQLKRSLVAYRLAFGQPRQEELVAYLQGRFSREEIDRLKDELHIDLAPPRLAASNP